MKNINQSALSLAILMAFSTSVFASVGNITINGEQATVDDATVGFSLGTDNDIVEIIGKPNRPRDALAMDGKGSLQKVTVKGKSISFQSVKGIGILSSNGASINIGSNSTETLSVSSSFDLQSGLRGGLIAYTLQQIDTNLKTEINAIAKNIEINVNNQKDAMNGSQLAAIYAGTGSSITLGNEYTKNISLRAEGLTNKSTLAFGVWVDNNPSLNNTGGSIQLNGSTIEISAIGNHDVRAIHVGSNTLTPVERSQLSINAERVIIEAEHAKGGDSIGISAMSMGKVNISGDTTINANTAILARGDSIVEINTDGKHFTQINGDIDFNYDKKTSGSAVDAGVTLNLVGANSYWNGTPVYSFGSGQAPADKTAITGLKVGLSNGAQWTPAYIEDTTNNQEAGQVSIAINQLNFNDGIINVNDGSKQKVLIETLTGSGGSINVKATTKDGKAFESGSLEITQVDESSKTPNLIVQYTGIDADDVKDAKAAMASLNDSVKLTDSTKSLSKTNLISEGAVSGAIEQIVSADGTSSEIVQKTNTKLDAYGSVATLSAFQWRHDMNDLTKRMGELRTSPEGIGAWARVYGSEQEYGSQNIKAKNTSIQVGSDIEVGTGWKVGTAFTYTDGSADYARGSADNKAYGLGFYGSWFADNGQFVDLIAKVSRLETDFGLNGMDGSFDNNAYSLSAEYGWHFKLTDLAFIEPQAELTYGQVFGDKFTSGNGVIVEQDDFESFIGRVGFRTGFRCPADKGLVYVRASALHDFKGEANSIAYLASDRTVQSVVKNDLGGTWYEFGIGANFNFTDNAYGYVDFERTTGGEVDENYRWNVGFRYTF